LTKLGRGEPTVKKKKNNLSYFKRSPKKLKCSWAIEENGAAFMRGGPCSVGGTTKNKKNHPKKECGKSPLNGLTKKALKRFPSHRV